MNQNTSGVDFSTEMALDILRRRAGTSVYTVASFPLVMLVWVVKMAEWRRRSNGLALRWPTEPLITAACLDLAP